jgi:2-hydroxychromene-2-carboxylate isomerase
VNRLSRMKHITFYFDFISPYAYLAFEKLPEALMGHSYSVTYKPILFAALLKHHGQLGPAEIAPKRDWTYRQALWLARSQGVALQLPTAHPFNPLGLLRLAVACGSIDGASPQEIGAPNRYVVEALFRHAWQGGADAADADRLAAITAKLSPSQDANGDAAKAQLKANTAEAIARGVFGVPAFAVDDKNFWGFDALPMLRDYLNEDAWFDGGDWDAASQIRVGAMRSGVKLPHDA